jgi:hypothetical protein
MIKNNKSRQKPVSRFWACVFACNILLGLPWTQKFKKTRQFIIFTIHPWFGIGMWDFFSDFIGPTFIIDFELYGDPIWFYVLREIILLSSIFGSIVFWPFVVYLMFGWATEYNLKHFGYKSKKEWKKHHT